METSFHISLTWGIVIALVLAAVLLTPFLIREISKGKKQLTPRTPIGAGDARPGRPGDPAPGQPDAQADPYSSQAHADHASRPSRAS
jgi:hypothetical protein